MATYNKFNQFVEDVAHGVHDFSADDIRVYLSNAVPSASLDAVIADLAEIAAGDGYTAGGNGCTLTTSVETGGEYKLILADPATWTAAAGTFATFQYAVLFNTTPTSPLDPLIGWWDYGSAISLGAGETFTVDLHATNGVFTIT